MSDCYKLGWMLSIDLIAVMVWFEFHVLPQIRRKP
jgi:hypothetical protein